MVTPSPTPPGNFGSTTATHAEAPLSAQSLVDSIGLNVPFSASPAPSEVQTLESRLSALAVRHLRVGIVNNDANYDSIVEGFLNAANAKLDGITDCPGIAYTTASPTDAQQIQAFDAAIGNLLEVVEGPDEVDVRNDNNWVSDTISCLPNLRSAEPSLPFYGPSLANQLDDSTKLGNLQNYIDYGNAHRYFSGRNPGTQGWGGPSSCGTYGALTWAICETHVVSGNKPIVVTETGYNSQTEVDEATQAKYLSRLFFVNLGAGISRSYVFDLLDDTATTGFNGDGLLRSDFSQKPSYYAIQNLVAQFADSGTVSALPLHFGVTAGKTIEHLLFKRSNGTYMLALWNEATSWNVSTNKEVAVAAQTVSVTTEVTPSNIVAMSFNDSGALVNDAVATSGDTMSLPVDDHLTILTFTAP